MKQEEKAKRLMDEMFMVISDFRVIDETLDDAAKSLALICIGKQLELLRYLGTKTAKELYAELIKQKVALK
jgi:ribonucleotide reductase alpha subunit